MARTQVSRSAACWLATAAALLGMAQPALAQLTTYTTEATWLSAVTVPTLIGFDDLASGTPVNTQYAGLTFSPYNGGNPLAMIFSLPQAGPNLLSLGTPPLTGGGGGVAVDFSAPQAGVAFWYLDSEIAGNSVSVFGAANLLLGTFPLAFPHPAEWQFIGFTSSANDITRIAVTIDAADMVALDSLQVSAVPEPQTWALLLAGLVWVGRAARHRRG